MSATISKSQIIVGQSDAAASTLTTPQPTSKASSTATTTSPAVYGDAAPVGQNPVTQAITNKCFFGPPPRAQNSQGNDDLSTHVVTSGESVASIASQYGVTPKELECANPQLKQCGIKAGMKLQIPDPPPSETTSEGSTGSTSEAGSTATGQGGGHHHHDGGLLGIFDPSQLLGELFGNQ